MKSNLVEIAVEQFYIFTVAYVQFHILFRDKVLRTEIFCGKLLLYFFKASSVTCRKLYL